MALKLPPKKPYDRLLSAARLRTSKVKGRSLEEEADADRGRVLFCAPFRRLQNKAQVFALESNAAVRSRLTHSLEVASIGRIVAQQALTALGPLELDALGIAGRERPLLTFVETACLLHDIGNPPFGHFGEIAISDWFHQKADPLKPDGIGGATLQRWGKYYNDFQHFDGNPQGLRICTRLQPKNTRDLCGLNLTATTLAAILKYPWTSDGVGEALDRDEVRKKPGFFWTEKEVIDWVWTELEITPGCRHPLVYLMEAADDIAYCVSDIEDGLEKGLITGEEFAHHMLVTLGWSAKLSDRPDADKDEGAILDALNSLQNPVHPGDAATIESVTPVQDLRAAMIRLLSRHAGAAFAQTQPKILAGTAGSLLRQGQASLLLGGLKDFAAHSLYSSQIVRSREITAHAVLSGLLDAYHPIMCCDRGRFDKALAGATRDDRGRSISRESALVGRIARKYLAVYHEAVRIEEDTLKMDPGALAVMERIHRMRLIVDYLSGMTDQFALQTFQHVSGAHVDPYRN